ncbi:MAG: tetratricopeptide repeat protein [Nocardioidaceae bacterium]
MTAERDLEQIEHLLHLGRSAEAETRLRRLLADEPTSAAALLLLNRALLRQERAEEALPVARAACATAPDLADAHIALSTCLTRLDRIPEAIEAARRAVAIAPQSWVTHYHLAYVLLQGRRPRTRDAYEAGVRAVGMNPGSAEAHNIVGMALADLGDNAGARRAYENALGIDPQLATAINNLAALELSERRLHVGARGLSRALAVDPQSRLVQQNLRGVVVVALRWLYVAVIGGLVLLALLVYGKAGLVLRAPVGVALLGVYAVLVARFVRTLPAGVRRSPRQLLRLIPWFAWLYVAVLLAASGIGLVMAFGSLDWARAAGLLVIPIGRGLLLAVVVGGTVAAGKALVSGK